VLIRCGDPTRWRNHYCVEDVTGVPLVTTPDVAEMGVEIDWMQFNWSLTRGQDSVENGSCQLAIRTHESTLAPCYTLNDRSGSPGYSMIFEEGYRLPTAVGRRA